MASSLDDAVAAVKQMYGNRAEWDELQQEDWQVEMKEWTLAGRLATGSSAVFDITPWDVKRPLAHAGLGKAMARASSNFRGAPGWSQPCMSRWQLVKAWFVGHARRSRAI